MASLLALLSSILPLVVKVVGLAPEVVSDIENAIGLVQSGSAPTAAQQASIDSALDVVKALVDAGGTLPTAAPPPPAAT